MNRPNLAEREAHLRYYWRIMNEGLAAMTVSEFQDEMECIALRTDSKELKEMCRRAMTRYDRGFTIVRAARVI